MKDKPEYILCAALYVNDGKFHEDSVSNKETGYLICGYRHSHCFASARASMSKSCDHSLERKENVGFLTSKNRFVSRRDAYDIAKREGQLLHNMHDETMLTLSSECIY
jgi:hypothetical protein